MEAKVNLKKGRILMPKTKHMKFISQQKLVGAVSMRDFSTARPWFLTLKIYYS